MANIDDFEQWIVGLPCDLLYKVTAILTQPQENIEKIKDIAVKETTRRRFEQSDSESSPHVCLRQPSPRPPCDASKDLFSDSDDDPTPGAVCMDDLSNFSLLFEPVKGLENFICHCDFLAGSRKVFSLQLYFL